ncbi:hypothetical protein VPHD148_0095 [Vibrio phage D148]
MDLKCYCGGTFEVQSETMGHIDFNSCETEYTRTYMECDSCPNQFMTEAQQIESAENLEAARKEDGVIDHEAVAIATIERFKARGGILPGRVREYTNQQLARAIDCNEFTQMTVKPNGVNMRIGLSDYMDSIVVDIDPTVHKELIELLSKNVAMYQ